ncbi:MAG: DUF3592 domain-containing protein [Hoeflea sp.]|uniref:DUF3592 domain-containing protein n=1 Tax=Hoeflea sp. TaxID=1940281 RepID=UPI0032EF70D6
MLARIQHVFETLKTNWSSDPAARGAAKMTAGAILVAEGFFGVLRGDGGGKSNGKGGLVGGLIGLAVGIVFVVIGGFVKPEPPGDAIETSGVIVGQERARRDGKSMYSAVIEFKTTGGETYRFTESAMGSSRPREGGTATVIYSESDPNIAYRTDGIGGWLPTIFVGAGILVAATSFLSLLISMALIVAGIVIFRQGRKDRRDAGSTDSFFSDLMSLTRKARSGETPLAGDHAGPV